MIEAMIGGRLKAPAQWLLNDKIRSYFKAEIIADDAANRAQVIALETHDETIGRQLRRLPAGASLTVTGPTQVLPGAKLSMRVRTLTALTQGVDPVTNEAESTDSP